MTRLSFGVGLLGVLLLVGQGTGRAQDVPPTVPPVEAALIREAAGRLDDTLTAVAASTRGLAAAYRDLSEATTAAKTRDRTHWLQNYAVEDGTVAFRDRENTCADGPATGAPCPSYFFYDGENFTDETFRQLAIMHRLAPALAAAHATFPFSWVYVTAVSQNFVIYPSLSLDEARHNFQPTKQDFYTCADFEHKACGWQSPYFDLVGGGMMVTVSCPATTGDTLLGVVSRDITLDQLSRLVLADLAGIPGARAILMNRRGKAIAASDPKVAAAISRENAKAKDAVVSFRTDRGLTTLNLEKGIASPDSTLNQAAETVIERAKTAKTWPMVFNQRHDTVLAARLRTTGWYLVVLLPSKDDR